VVKFLDLAVNLVFNVFRGNDISVLFRNYPAQQQTYQNMITVFLYLFKDTFREFEGSTKVVFSIPEFLTNLTLNESDGSKFRLSLL
jgi:hypothetical protein